MLRFTASKMLSRILNLLKGAFLYSLGALALFVLIRQLVERFEDKIDEVTVLI